jgi:hypothetical protein
VGTFFCFILISWGCLTTSTLFIFLQWANLIGPRQKKVETMEAPQNRRFYEKMECLPLWPTYIGDNWRTLGKTYGIKARFYWEHPWEHIGTKERWKNPPRDHQSKTFFFKNKAPWVHAEPSHCLHEISMFQNYSSLVLARANNPIINQGYLFTLGSVSVYQKYIHFKCKYQITKETHALIWFYTSYKAL